MISYANPTEIVPAEQQALFRADVERLLRAAYMLPCGTVVKGQSLTHLQACLRDVHDGRRWRLGGGYWGITTALQEAGFTLQRARTMRYTRNGQYKPYQPCQVVLHSPPQPYQPASE